MTYIEQVEAIQKEIRKLEKKEDKWICKICNKKYPSNAYCVENHFAEKHPNIEMSSYWDEDFEENGNWDNINLSEKEENKLRDLKIILSEIQIVTREKLRDWEELKNCLNEFAQSNEARVNLPSNSDEYISITLKSHIENKITDCKNASKLIKKYKNEKN